MASLERLNPIDTIQSFARDQVQEMMKKGVPLAAIENEFQMKAFGEWDRTEHLPWIAATIHRELQGLGPQIITVAERRLSGVVSSAVQDGRFVTVTTGDGTQVRLGLSAHAQLTSCFRSGRLRTRFPVTRNTALTIAGGICAIASSPTPSSQ